MKWVFIIAAGSFILALWCFEAWFIADVIAHPVQNVQGDPWSNAIIRVCEAGIIVLTFCLCVILSFVITQPFRYIANNKGKHIAQQEDEG